MRAGIAIPLILTVLLLTLPLAFSTMGTAFDARIERLVGTPTPVGPALAASDRSAWAITLDNVAYVEVVAEAPPNSPFYLTASCVPGLVAAPASRQALSCPPHAGTYTVEVDPAGGVAIDITIRFRGHVRDRDGAAYAFGFVQTAADQGCIVPGVCLP